MHSLTLEGDHLLKDGSRLTRVSAHPRFWQGAVDGKQITDGPCNRVVEPADNGAVSLDIDEINLWDAIDICSNLLGSTRIQIGTLPSDRQNDEWVGLPSFPVDVPLEVVLTMLQQSRWAIVARFDSLWVTTPEDRDQWCDETGVSALRFAPHSENEGLMDSRVTLENFDQIPLRDMLDVLSLKHRVKFIFDIRAEERFDFQSDMAVSINVRDIRFRSALGVLCDQAKLCATVVGDKIALRPWESTRLPPPETPPPGMSPALYYMLKGASPSDEEPRFRFPTP